MVRKLTVEKVIDRLQAKIDRMEAKMFSQGLDLLVSDQEEFEAKIEAYEEVIELLRRV